MNKMLFVAWVKFDRRSDLLAHHLQADMRYVQVGKRGSLLHAPLRYLRQSIMTWRILREERPDIVLTQTPPIFAPVVLYLYCRLHRKRYVIDAHSASFVGDSIWAKLWPLHRFLSRRAVVTVVSNQYFVDTVESWGGKSIALGFTPGEYLSECEPYPLREAGFHVAVICSYDDDEPIAEVFEAARRLPDVAFYISGDSKRLPHSLAAKKPDNCTFTGYLPEAQYIGLLRGVDAIMDLTKLEHTLLMGAYEAISLVKPLITSNTELLRVYFPIGTVHVENTPEGICAGVREARMSLLTLQREMVDLRQQLEQEWDTGFDQLRQLLASA